MMEPLLCQPLLYSSPFGDSYVSALWQWRHDLGYRSPHMEKAVTLVEIHRAIPEVWYDDDKFAMGVTGGNMDAVIWR